MNVTSRDKMFNPKITPGPWEWENLEEYNENELHLVHYNLPKLVSKNDISVCEFGNEDSYYPREGEPPSYEDAKAIASVPELLEVYKATRGF